MISLTRKFLFPLFISYLLFAFRQEISKGASAEEYRKYVESVIPDYDRDRVYPNDIKRIVDWYNIVVNAGITEFVEK